MFFLSPRGISLPFRTVSILSTGTDSPVRAASSAFIEADFMIRASAGTLSPASSSMISPGTSSSLSIVIIFPFLLTFDLALDMFCRASIAFSAFDSCTTPSTALMRTTTRMIIASDHSVSPEAVDVMTESTAAIIRMISIGSASFERNCLIIPSFFFSSSLFLPYSDRRFDASLSDSPLGEDESDEITSSALSRYSFFSIVNPLA